MRKGFCLITNDVEDLSITGLSYDEIGKKVSEEAMPRLLDLYDKYGVKATLFFVAQYAQKYPEMVKRALAAGHEVACHGLTHKQECAFDVMSFEQQLEHLKKAKAILENIAGVSVVSFRAPALRVNQYTATALMEAGFVIDSSVAPQRMDLFMSLGSKNKMQWLGAPRMAYETANDNLARKGGSGIYEVPVSSFGLPYIGTLMRISPTMNRLARYLLFLETKNTNKGVNFLFHPSEGVAENDEQTITRKRTDNVVSHFFSDILRVKLKKKHLDESAFDLFEDELVFWRKNGYLFTTLKQYVETIKI